MTTTFAEIAEASWFKSLVMAAIIAAGILVGVQTYELTSPAIRSHAPLIQIIDQGIIAIFVIEAVVKIGAEGNRPWNYFRDPWNVLISSSLRSV